MRTQKFVIKNTKIFRNEKFIKIKTDEQEIKSFPKKENEKLSKNHKFLWKILFVISNHGLSLIKVVTVRNFKELFKKRNHQMDENVRRQKDDFPKKLPYSNKKSRQIYDSMMIKRYRSKEDTINKLEV